MLSGSNHRYRTSVSLAIVEIAGVCGIASVIFPPHIPELISAHLPTGTLRSPSRCYQVW